MTALNIGIILGSTRQGRVSPQVGEWVKGIADARGDANYEIVDIADFKLPLLGRATATLKLRLGQLSWLPWTDSYSSFRNITTVSPVH